MLLELRLLYLELEKQYFYNILLCDIFYYIKMCEKF